MSFNVDKNLVQLSPEDEDLRDYKWKLGTNGYVYLTTAKFGKQEIHRIVGKRIGMHSNRKLVLDHINRKKFDNRRDNLRLVSGRESTLNTSRLDNAKGIRCTPTGKWVAYIVVNNISHHLGTFDTEAEASNAYRIARISDVLPITRVKHRGGYYSKSNKRWKGETRFGGRYLFLGWFDSEQEMTAVYDAFMAKVKPKGYVRSCAHSAANVDVQDNIKVCRVCGKWRPNSLEKLRWNFPPLSTL